MPTNLGAMPTDLPLTVGKVQMKRGAADGSVVVSAANAGAWISDGAGGRMEIYYRPRYTCYWVVRANIMAHGVTDGAGWRRWDCRLNITPADADGVSLGFIGINQLYDNNYVEWKTFGFAANFRLSAGVGYTAFLTTDYTSAGSVRYHTGPIWLRLIGRIVGEGFV